MQYKNKNSIMKNEEIRTDWIKFTDKYNYLFKTAIEKWNSKLLLVENYIINYGILPVKSNKNTDIKNLATWIICQKKQYKNNSFIMKDQQNRIIWENFTEKYKEYF